MNHTDVVLSIMVNTKSGKVKKWINGEYKVEKNEYVEHQDVKMYYNTNQFPLLSFFGKQN